MVRREENTFNNCTPPAGMILSLVCTAVIMAFFMYKIGWRIEFFQEPIPARLNALIYFPTKSKAIRNNVLLIRYYIAKQDYRNLLISVMVFGAPYFALLWVVWKVCSLFFEAVFGNMRNGLRL